MQMKKNDFSIEQLNLSSEKGESHKPTVAPRTELVDSDSRSVDRIDGFPQ